MSTFNVFTYGTLRSNGPAADVMKDCTLRGTATLGGMLYDIDGRFPALVIYGDAPVHGEVWECPAPLLLRLDEYEDVHGGLFRRVGVEVTAEDGSTVPCWVYAAGPGLSRKLVPDARIRAGEWTPPGGVVGR